MTVLYCTADQIGASNGGGLVTQQELLALQEFVSNRLVTTRDLSFSSLMVLGRDQLAGMGDEPWKWDERAYEKIRGDRTIKLAHFYSGTFGKTVEELKKNDCKVTYTIAAHERKVSRNEHEKLGFGFPFPHLTEEKLWQRYIQGYRLSDVLVTPGRVPEQTIRDYGSDFQNKPICIIPHGCELPEEVKDFPSNFVLGYAGSFGADKGVRYLLQAWKELDYRDGSMLVLAGRDSTSPIGKYFLQKFGGGCIQLMGWVEDISSFYNAISCYVQPSATEGFGLEVLEAMAHGRPVICSKAAGVQDLVPNEAYTVPARNVNALKEKIKAAKSMLTRPFELTLPSPYDLAAACKNEAQKWTWSKIRSLYQNLWQEVLS